MQLDLPETLRRLALRRPVFHSERDLQHALAWQIQLDDPLAEVRLEPRPRRGIHLDLLVTLGGRRTAIEIKYPVAGFQGTVDSEHFDLPNQSAQDLSRYDTVKDIVRVEALLAEGYADCGFVFALTNDGGFWRAGIKADPIDAAFRLHEGRTLEGRLTWAPHAGGTTNGRSEPLSLRGRYFCGWRDFSSLVAGNGRKARFRYLLLPVARGSVPAVPTGAGTQAATVPPPAGKESVTGVRFTGSRTARDEILDVARHLSRMSATGSFTLAQVVGEMRRRGSRYAESTIRTHVVSRMCADSPDHHATTFDDFDRVGNGQYRLRQ